jgi:hypothetical protein
MKPDDFVTSWPLIGCLYHCVRNQFKHIEILRKRVQEFIEDQGSSGDDIDDEVIAPSVVTRG